MAISPDRRYFESDINSIRPSWSDNPGYINDLHREIYSMTKGLDGWQEEADAYKLFEMSYFAGDMILEIGTYAGRSAVVELKGALSNPLRTTAPQFFGVDIDLGAVIRTHNTLQEHSLVNHALLFPGNVEQFFQALPIVPTMVFVDGDHSYEACRSDLQVLSRSLASDTPILFHDWSSGDPSYGVKKACDEFQDSGHISFIGRFGVCGLYLTTPKCVQPRKGLDPDQFQSLRRSFLQMLINTCKDRGISVA